MKRILKWIIVLLAATWTLAACGGVASVPPAASSATMEPVNTAVLPTIPAVESGAATVDYHPENLALIGKTGRPQLINVFASW